MAQAAVFAHRDSTEMKKIYSAAPLIATAIALLLPGCATQLIPKEELTHAAFITSSSTNLWSMGSLPNVSVVAVDGVAVQKHYGPIELTPGPHQVEMKCGKNTNTLEIDAAAGDVYEFSVVINTTARSPASTGGCQGSLYKARSAANSSG